MASTSVQPPQELAAAWPLSSTSPSISTSAPSQQYQVSPELSQPSVVQPVHQHVPLAQQPQQQHQQQQAMGDFAPSHLAAIPATNNPTSSAWYYHENNGWKWTRIVLHGLCLVASIAGLAVSGLLVSGTSRIGGIKEPNVALGVFLLTLILSVVELAARFVPNVKRDNGLNPNIAVAGWLLSAWSAIPTAVINSIIIAQYYAGDYYDDDQEEEYQTYVDYMGSTRKEFLNRTIAVTAILGIVAVAAFALWVGACVEAARYNKSIGAARSSGVAGPKTVYADGWGRFKMALNVLGFVFCAIGGALSVSLIVYQNMAFGTDNYDTPSDGSYRYYPDYDEVAEVFPFMSLIFFVPLLWIAAELCTVLARKRKAGIHPGAHVGLWLVFLVGISLGAGAMLTSGPISSKCWPNIDRPTSDGYRVSVSSDPKCVSERGIAAASIVFACFMVVVACFLFIAACADTAVRNATQVTTYVYMPFQDQHAQGSMQPVQLANGKTAMAMVYGAPPAQPAQVYAPVPAPPDTVWQTRQ